jgi:amino acid transporter
MPTNDTPRWQLWLLARLPRPLAVMLMIVITGMVSLLGALVLIFLFILLVMLGKPIGVTPFGILAVLTLVPIVVTVRCMYRDFNQQLPAREKKKGDDGDRSQID